MFQNIKQKPKQVRNQYAFWTALSITSVIALIWAVSLKYSLDGFSVTATAQNSDSLNSSEDFTTVIDDVKSNVSDAWSSIATSTSKNGTTSPATSSKIRIETSPRATSSASSTRAGDGAEATTTDETDKAKEAATSSKYRFIRVKPTEEE